MPRKVAKHTVHRNLHQVKKGGPSWSVTFRSLVIGWEERYILSDVTFRIRPAGRAEVIRLKKKGVHAYVAGTPEVTHEAWLDEAPTVISYNPYRGDHFYEKSSNRDIIGARLVEFFPCGKVEAYGLIYAEPELAVAA